jgi:urease accessory protein
LAIHVGADLEVMARDSRAMRGEGPFVFAQAKNDVGIDRVVDLVLQARAEAVMDTSAG